MKYRRIPGLTYANVIATIALFVALGGGAIAASTLGKNSVGPKQLKKNAVTTAKIKNKVGDRGENQTRDDHRDAGQCLDPGDGARGEHREIARAA